MFVAGEHCDYDTRLWAQKVFKTPVLDNWWQVGIRIIIIAINHDQNRIQEADDDLDANHDDDLDYDHDDDLDDDHDDNNCRQKLATP